jgi:hypothetical protein
MHHPLLKSFLLFSASAALAIAGAPPVPAYDHIAVIIEENHGYLQIIGNSAAPNLNRLAATYGLATSYYTVADPSAPNYVAMLVVCGKQINQYQAPCGHA